MKQKLAFVHTVPSLVGLFNDLSKELLPGVEVLHVADEMLLKVVLAQGGLSPFIFQRVAEHVVAAERAGATAVQCTCSSISPCVDASRPLVGIPVLKIDEPMVDAALRVGPCIGIAATAPTTLKPTTDLVHARAAAQGLTVKVESALCEGAYAALFSGDGQTHDRIVSEVLHGLMKRNDVVILAQASMARVAQAIPAEEQSVPILSSPRLAMEYARTVLLAG
ncbi:MAG TPA: aspartate/glutamate racemase family protein [Anaerolineales bacterium]|nr:aspartate/glutamate racemase family protein [Anaerolineales bacterium]